MMAATDAVLPVTDLGLLGIAATETLRTFRHEVFRVDRHLDRLRQTLSLVAIEASSDLGDLHSVIHEVARRNCSLLSPDDDLRLLVFVTPGPNPAYGDVTDSRPTVCVHSAELGLHRWRETIQDGLHVEISEVRQIPAECVPAEAKTRSRIHWHRAAAFVSGHEHREPLLLNADGYVTETPCGNFLTVHGNRIVTAPSDVLPGVSREMVAELSVVLDMEFEERHQTPEEVARADEAFVSSTPYSLLPVTQFCGKPIGNGRPGPVFFELSNAWSEQVGVDIIEQVLKAPFDSTLGQRIG